VANARKYLYLFLISMVPIAELRAAIPFGHINDLSPVLTYLFAVVGNFLPVPFIILFIRRILLFMKRVKYLDKIALFLEKKAEKNRGKVERYATFGLMFFVALPLPGTGAWTGALVAALMNMRMKNALLSILGGILIAGCIMTLVSWGALGFLSFLIPA